jgi:hypothetical protein
MKPTTGIFYVIRYPEGWEVVASRHDEYPDDGHPDFWRRAAVTAMLAQRWHKALDLPSDELSEDLRKYDYGFPRGRIAKVGKQYCVYYGKDIQPYMKISRKMVERLFNIEGKARWVFDEHEQCLKSDKEEVQRLLRIKEDWPSVA